MAILLVTYDLNSPGQKREKLLEAIKQYPWAKLSESSYAIRTSHSPKAIYDSLTTLLDNNDNLYVLTLTAPYWGRGPQDVNDWLAGNL